MKRIYLRNKNHVDAWKGHLQAKDATAAHGLLAPMMRDHGVAADEAAEVVLTRPHAGAATGKRLKTIDDAMAFLKGAAQDVKDAARDDLGDMERIAIPVVISDDTEDRDRDIVVPGGGDLTEHKKNPVMLFGHDHRTPAIGNGFGTHPMDNQVRSVATFNPADVDEFGFMIGRMFEERIMRAISIGFIPKEWTFEQDRGPMAMRYLSWELIEYSAVNVGSNRNSLTQARGLGIDIKPGVDMLSKALDGGDANAEEAWRLVAPRKMFSLPALKEEVGRLSVGSAAQDAKTGRADARKAPEKPKTEGKDTLPVTIEWCGVAVMLAADADPESFARAVRANTYGGTDEEQAERVKDAATSQAGADDLLAAISDESGEERDGEEEGEPVAPVVDNVTPAGNAGSHIEGAADEPVDLSRILAVAQRHLG